MADDTQKQVIIQPPPRLTGNSDSDVVAMSQYLGILYQAAFVEGGVATPQDVTDAVEGSTNPAIATASTAQTTANSALSIATAQKTRLDAMAGGQFTVSGAATSVVVALTTAQTDTAYYVTATASSSTGGPAAGAFTVAGISKATGQFTVTLLAAPGVGSSVTFDWHLRR